MPKIRRIKENTYCGHKGTELEWIESKDDKLLAGYKLYRNGQLIDFIAIGTFYFDISRKYRFEKINNK